MLGVLNKIRANESGQKKSEALTQWRLLPVLAVILKSSNTKKRRFLRRWHPNRGEDRPARLVECQQFSVERSSGLKGRLQCCGYPWEFPSEILPVSRIQTNSILVADRLFFESIELELIYPAWFPGNPMDGERTPWEA
jgi:hypothetical protein